MTHVDKFINDYDQDAYARWMFMLFRLPAAMQVLARKFVTSRLFCTWQGRRYRVTGASRFGDVWLTGNHDKDHGYDARVDVAECSDWGCMP